MADHPLAALAHRALGSDNRRGIDLECACRIGRDIGGGLDTEDVVVVSEQQPAAFIGVRRLGLREQLGMERA